MLILNFHARSQFIILFFTLLYAIYFITKSIKTQGIQKHDIFLKVRTNSFKNLDIRRKKWKVNYIYTWEILFLKNPYINAIYKYLWLVFHC